MAIPFVLTAGDTVRQSEKITGMASADWELKYSIHSAQKVQHVGSATNADGVSHDLDFVVDLPPGRYTVTRYVVDRSDPNVKQTFDGGQTITVRPDPTSNTPQDMRSHNRKMLDMVEAALEGRASEDTLDELEAGLGNRNWRNDPAELRKWRSYYQKEVRWEESGGLTGPQSVKMTFTRSP